MNRISAVSAISVIVSMTMAETPLLAQSASAMINVGTERKVIVKPQNNAAPFAIAAKDSARLLTQDRPNNAKLRANTVHNTSGADQPADVVQPETQSIGKNPYIGAQLAYSFGGNKGELASNIVASGNFVYSLIESDTTGAVAPAGRRAGQIKSAKKYALLVNSNISTLATDADTTTERKVGELVSSNRGMSVGLESFYVSERLSGPLHQTKFVAAAGWKLNGVKDKLDTTRYLALGRLSAGIEIGIGSRPDKLPLVIATNFVYSAFSDQTYKKLGDAQLRSSIKGAQLTIVTPISDASAFLTEAVFRTNARPVWRFGILAVASRKGSS